MDPSFSTRRYLSAIGRKGGLRSRRRLDGAEARRMVAVREARRAFRDYHDICFWSYSPDATIGLSQLPWVVETLKREGDRRAYEWARRISACAGN
jgi:hypothetical protein